MNYYFCSANEETLNDDWISIFNEEEKKRYSFFKEWAHPISELKEYIKNHPKCKIYKNEIENLSEEAYNKYVKGLNYWEPVNDL